jgi:hypothetical protein
MGEPPVPEAGATGIVTSVNPIEENGLVKAYEVKIRVSDYEWTVLKYLPTPGRRYLSPPFNEFMKDNAMFIGPFGNGIGISLAPNSATLGGRRRRGKRHTNHRKSRKRSTRRRR